MLGRGSTGVAFVVGSLLSFPGLSYLAALGRIAKVDPGTAVTVLLVVGFCLVQLLLLEAPLLGFTFAPERTRSTIASFRAWVDRRGRSATAIAAATLGTILIVIGLVSAL